MPVVRREGAGSVFTCAQLQGEGKTAACIPSSEGRVLRQICHVAAQAQAPHSLLRLIRTICHPHVSQRLLFYASRLRIRREVCAECEELNHSVNSYT